MGPGNWSAEYYEDLISVLGEKHPDKEIVVYTEEMGSEDLDQLKGATVVRGDASDLGMHFREMVNAGYFIPSCSSVSTWAAYLSEGTVLIPDKEIKHFQHNENLPNWISLSSF